MTFVRQASDVEYGPGIYARGDEFHVDAVELARAVGHPSPESPEAQAVAERVVAAVCAEHGIAYDVADDNPRETAQLVDVWRGSPRCAGCGCTDLVACAGGCSWVQMDPPMCSRCLPDG